MAGETFSVSTSIGAASTALGGRPWKRAAAWLAFLGPFFFLTYGLANWWTAQLPHVPSLMFEWEQHIPFLPWTILPYMSIDLFYAASLFVCANRQELDRHAKRLLAATALSVVGFLLFPLRFSLERPEVAGFNGWLFDVLTGFDKPFNQAPSLHVSLLMLLWVVYARHLPGRWRWLLHGWFFLIGVSVFTTFQHHAIDGVTGAIVGIVCLYLFPDPPHSTLFNRNAAATPSARLASYYLAGSLTTGCMATTLGGWAWGLLWPACALLLVATAYRGAGTAVFQKHLGSLSWPASILLAPYLAGAWLSSRWFTRNDKDNGEVVPGIWIGRAPARADWKTSDMVAVLDLTAECPACEEVHRRFYSNMPMLDLVTPDVAQLRRAVAALQMLSLHGPVLVHCALGYSRSALVIAAWLLQSGEVQTVEQAVAKVRAARPRIVLSEQSLAVLRGFGHG